MTHGDDHAADVGSGADAGDDGRWCPADHRCAARIYRRTAAADRCRPPRSTRSPCCSRRRASRRGADRPRAPQTKGKAFNPSSTGYEIVKALTPRDGEIVDRQGPAQRLRRHRAGQAPGGERPQEPDRRRLHDPHVRVGDGALGDRPRLHEHDRRRHGGDARPAGCDGRRDGRCGRRSTASRWRRCRTALPGSCRRPRRSPDFSRPAS